MGRFNIWEIVIVLVLIVIIFGGRKLPELGRSLGRGITNFRNALKSNGDAASGEDKPGDDASKETKKSGEG
ncbi:MAG: twin-arginine translocase TatA/TatE family subunit [Deltaproteobacteria bacterium]|jgi:sec-independent protein translocase protein TatA|nr:twin-arginine translocase TatA/TatE family subunit [Deltaproteobacteria bacterium]